MKWFAVLLSVVCLGLVVGCGQDAATDRTETTPVESSVMDEVEYDADAQVLTITFDSGKVYRYKGVPEGVYGELMAADSKGTYFNASIKGQYEFEDVSAE